MTISLRQVNRYFVIIYIGDGIDERKIHLVKTAATPNEAIDYLMRDPEFPLQLNHYLDSLRAKVAKGEVDFTIDFTNE